MKNFLIIFLLSVVMLACRPEPTIEDMQNAANAVATQDIPIMQNKEHHAEVRLSVPDTTWSLKIINVTQTEDELAVICQLTQSDMMGLMVISEVVDAVRFTAKDLPIKYYIKGKTWGWENQEDYTFMDADSEIQIQNGEPVAFESVEPHQKGGPKRQPIGTPL